MKKFWIGLLLFAVLPCALGAMLLYWWMNTQGVDTPLQKNPVVEVKKETQKELENIADKLKDQTLKTKDGAEVNVDELISTDENGNISPNMEAIKNLDSQTIQDVANTLSPDDVEALKK